MQPDRLPKCSDWVKGLAMRWHEQLKSETCFLKKVICFKYGRSLSAKAIKIQYHNKTVESFRNGRRKKGKIEKEKQQGPREKSARTERERRVHGPREKSTMTKREKCKDRERKAQ